MATFFLDTSALVKLYVREPGTDHMLRLASEEDAELAVLSISAVEFRSALRRRERDGDVSSEDSEAIIQACEQDFADRFIRHQLSDAALQVAASLVDRYALRAYDAVQLAGGLTFPQGREGSLTFVCADLALLRAAKSEGLLVLNPVEA